jgi:tetratricopeptide (TPR) repeat protein
MMHLGFIPFRAKEQTNVKVSQGKEEVEALRQTPPEAVKAPARKGDTEEAIGRDKGRNKEVSQEVQSARNRSEKRNNMVELQNQRIGRGKTSPETSRIGAAEKKTQKAAPVIALVQKPADLRRSERSKKEPEPSHEVLHEKSEPNRLVIETQKEVKTFTAIPDTAGLIPEKATPVNPPLGETQEKELFIDRYYQNGLIAQKRGDYREAEKFYLAVLKEAPSHIDSLTNLSAVYIQLRRYPEAKELLHRIIQQDKRNAKSHVNLGIVDMHLGQYLSATQWLQEALRINPREESALINLAYLAQKENNTVLLEKYYRELLDVSPQNESVLLSYASLLEGTERYSDAVTCYQRALELDKIKNDQKLSRQIKERINLLAYYIRNEND